jgi:endonuclease/exonuclease/phosphatase family metal-dependent hydrolase
MPDNAPPSRSLWRFLFLALITLLFLEALRVFLASIYLLNAATLSLNASVTVAFLLVAPLVYPLGLHRVSRETAVAAFTTTLVAFRLLLALPLPVVGLVFASGLAATSVLFLLAPVLATILAGPEGPGLAAAAVAAGVALDTSLRVAGLTLDPTVTSEGAVLVVVLLAATGLAWYRLRGSWSPSSPPPSRTTRVVVPRLGVGFGLFLGLEVVVLLYPAFVARWAAVDYQESATALILGTVVAAALAVAWPGRLAGPAARVGLSASLVAFALLLFLGGDEIALLLLLFLAALAAVAALLWLLRLARDARLSVGRFGLVWGLAGLTLVLFAFVFVFTLVYAHVPGRLLWEGRTAIVGVGATLLFLLAAAPGGRLPSLSPAPRPTRRLVSIVLAATLLLTALGFAAAPPPTARPPSMGPIAVMTYNVHQAFGMDGVLDVPRIAATIAAEDPDIVALQESDTVRLTSEGVDVVRYLATTLGYEEAYGPPTREQTYGVAILSRFPILSWRYLLLPSLDDQRVLVEARLDVRGTVLTVFAVHLGLTQEERMLQIVDVLARTASAPDPKVLLGDFNSCPGGLCPGFEGPSDTVYAQVAAGWQDTWTATGGAANDPRAFTFPAAAPEERIDYVFVRGVAVVAAYTAGPPSPRSASDHLPVVAVLAP